MIFLSFFKDFIYLFLERGREGGRVGEKHKCVVASLEPLTGDVAHDPGICSNWESNQRCCGLQAGTQSTEPHLPGLHLNNQYSQHTYTVSNFIWKLSMLCVFCKTVEGILTFTGGVVMCLPLPYL